MKEDLYDDLYLEEKEEKTDFKAVLFKYTDSLALVRGMHSVMYGRSLALFALHPAGIQYLGIRHHQGQ